MAAPTYPLFTDAATALAARVDSLFVWVCVLTVSVAAGIFAVIIWFVIRYRKGVKRDRTHAPAAQRQTLQRRFEIAWSSIPLMLFVVAFAWAADLYYVNVTVPKDALPIYIVAKQWMWHAEHPAGEREIDELHVPLGRPVELLMTSQDVIHSLSIPDFRIKQDVLPGRYTTLWFTANRAGEYRLYCTQFCGTSHSRMVGRVVVMEPAAFEGWLSARANLPSMAARGAQRYRQLGCDGCHGAQAGVRAPKLEGLFGRPVELRDGRSVLADERFIRDALLLPNQEVPAGYDASMPSFRGQIGEEDLLEIIEYLKSLGNADEQVMP